MAAGYEEAAPDLDETASTDYYAMFGIQETSSSSEIKAAYYRAVRFLTE